MWLQLSIVIVTSFVYESFAQKPHVTCDRDYKKIGCFKTNNNGNNRVDYEDMQMLLNDRDVTSPYHDGYLLNWRQFAESTHSLACRCAEKAKKEGYTYISIRFWGECHGGKDFSVIEKLLKQSGGEDWRSAHCSNPKFGVCDDTHKDECVGKANADYIYQVGQTKTEENVDGGFTEWSKWSACSATCGSNLIQERERTCTNPLPQGSGKPCDGEFSQTKQCEVSECPIDGEFTEWSEFGSCSVSCGGGMMKRKRSCTNPEPAHGGKICTGNLEESKPCGTSPCPVNGGYSEWSDFGTCSAPCGVGVQSRSRECNNPAPKFGGETCDAIGDKQESRLCKVKECPIDGGYGVWSEMSPCTKTCGGGTRARVRLCNNPVPKYGGRDCPGERQQIEECNSKPCPINGGFSKWSSYSTCTKSCGGGTQERTRMCNNPLPQHGGSECIGPVLETASCGERKCPIDGRFTQWGSFGMCSAKCGGGSKKRSRSCTNPAPAHGGKECMGVTEDIATCNTQPCPVNGGLSQWSGYGECSVKCGGGTKKRTRSCTNPSPAHGGKKCIGSTESTEVCNTISCPVDGKFGSWSSWLPCNKKCGGGLSSRTRTCSNPAAAHGGKDCSGSKQETKSCNNQKCPVDGKFGGWSTWSECTKTCDSGSQSRRRFCNSPAPAHGGKSCVGSSTETQICSTNGCPVDGNWSKYGAYGSCSKSCGGGIQRAMRYCTNPTPKYGGKGCTGPNNMIRVCNMQACAVNGGYGPWSSYSGCSRSCGGGSQTRTRACNNPSPKAGGKSCSILGASSMSKSCNTNACPPKWSGQRLRRTCEYNVMHLTCGFGGRIFIDSASYGRRTSSYCGWKFWYSRSCHSGSSNHQMIRRCNNKQSCSVPSSNAVFGDPCIGTVKYLEVKYKCKGGPYAG